jgi:hypothetical protein
VGAYLDQLARGNGLSSGRIKSIRDEMSRAERLSGQARKDALTQLATRVQADESSASDKAKVRLLGKAISDLSNAPGYQLTPN